MKSMLTRHVEKHTNYQKYQFDVCGHKFHSTQLLEQHSYTHKGKTGVKIHVMVVYPLVKCYTSQCVWYWRVWVRVLPLTESEWPSIFRKCTSCVALCHTDSSNVISQNQSYCDNGLVKGLHAEYGSDQIANSLIQILCLFYLYWNPHIIVSVYFFTENHFCTFEQK